MKAALTTLSAMGTLALSLTAQVRTTGPALQTTGPGIIPTAPPPTSPFAIPNTASAIAGAPPAAGSTFSRPIIGAPMAPANPRIVSASGFPPPLGPVAPVVTNTGIGGVFGGTIAAPQVSSFPPGPPPFIGNTVGTNFVAPATNFTPFSTLTVNPPGSVASPNTGGVLPPLTPGAGLNPGNPVQDFPPGTTIVNGPGGVPEMVVPPVAGPSVGAPGSVQSGTAPSVLLPPGTRTINGHPVVTPRSSGTARNPDGRIPPVVRP